MKIIIISLFLFLKCFITYSQNNLTVIGHIINNQKENIPFAVVAFIHTDNKKTFFAVCDEKGYFNLPKITEGNYTLNISHIAYQTESYNIEIIKNKNNLGSFILNPINDLNEAIITTQQQLIKSDIDRLIYDVEKDPRADTLNSLKILNNIPFVQIDNKTDNIKVFGEENNFKITINGKKSLLLSETNQYVAKTLKAKTLKKIELIINPDGNNVNQNAIINIITKSELPNGFASEISIHTSDDTDIEPSFKLTSKMGGFIYNLNYNFNYSDYYGCKTISNLIDYNSKNHKFIKSYTNESQGKQYNHNLDLNISYDISEFDLISINFNTILGKSNPNIYSHYRYFNEDHFITREFESISTNTLNDSKLTGNMSYQRSFPSKTNRLLTVNYNFDIRKNDNRYSQEIQPIINYKKDLSNIDNKLNNNEHSLGIDFYNSINSRNSYYIIAKYIHRNYDSDIWQQNTIDNNLKLTSTLDYIQQLASIQGNFSSRMSKLMLTIESAIEYTNNNINFGIYNNSLKKDYITCLAQIRLTYKPTQKHFFTINLNRSTYRPDVLYLNPFENKSNPGEVTKGTPNLDNEIYYRGLFSYLYFIHKKFNIRFLSTYKFSNNSVQQYSFLNNDGILIKTYRNIGKEDILLFNIGLNYTPTEWLDLNLITRISHNNFKYLENTNSYWDPFYEFSFSSELWKGAVFEGNLQFRSSNWIYNRNIQLSKQHIKLNSHFTLIQEVAKNTQITLSLRNPWNTYKIDKIEEHSNDYYTYKEQKSLGRIVSFSIKYNFGKFKESVKTVKRKITNHDRSKSL